MKKIVLITLFSYLLYSTLPAFAAAPPAAGSEQRLVQSTAQLLAEALHNAPMSATAGAGSSSVRAAEYQPAGDVEKQLEDWWTLSQEERIQDAMTQQLARIYVAESENPTPSIAELEMFFNKDKGHAFSPSIIGLVHRTLEHKRQHPIFITSRAKFAGDYDAFSQALWANIQHELSGQDGSYVQVYLSHNDLENMQPELLLQFIQELYGLIMSMHCRLLNLDLSNNRLTTLPAGIFGDLLSLQELSLSDNNLTVLPPEIFDGLQNLQRLSLGNNELTILSPRTFYGLQNLRVLYLSNNRLTALPTGIFNELHNLLDLRLGNNRLTTIEPGIFNGLRNLTWLVLSYNQLAALPLGIFGGLRKLQNLFILHNPIASDTAAIEELRRQLPLTCAIITQQFQSTPQFPWLQRARRL